MAEKKNTRSRQTNIQCVYTCVPSSDQQIIFFLPVFQVYKKICIERLEKKWY